MDLIGRIRASGKGSGLLLVIMYSLHVIKEIVPSWEPVARNTSLTSRVETQMWPISMSVHAMSFSFMPEQASRGRELLLGTGLNLAAEGLQVGVDELAVGRGEVSKVS